MLRTIDELKREDARVGSQLFAFRKEIKAIPKPMNPTQQKFVKNLVETDWAKLMRKVNSLHDEVFESVME